MHGVDIVVHAAALKQVPACEYNPIEAIQTNIIGGRNVIEAAIDNGVERVMALSTDKAVNPVNLYGATKLAAEKLFVQSNAYAGGKGTRFTCVRYGNVVGSRGSVVPVFLQQRGSGTITITDERMTRFWLTLEQGVRFTIALHRGDAGRRGLRAQDPEHEGRRPGAGDRSRLHACERIGIRPGEKLHEVLVSEDEARHTVELADRYVVQPPEELWFGHDLEPAGRRRCRRASRYSSDNNNRWLSWRRSSELVASRSRASRAGHEAMTQAADHRGGRTAGGESGAGRAGRPVTRSSPSISCIRSGTPRSSR